MQEYLSGKENIVTDAQTCLAIDDLNPKKHTTCSEFEHQITKFIMYNAFTFNQLVQFNGTDKKITKIMKHVVTKINHVFLNYPQSSKH
jgi:hypothetical protein